MTQSEILSLSADEVYRRVAELLWPWDETRCRDCGLYLGKCTKEICCITDWRGTHRGERQSFEILAQNLQSWSGVGRMVEAIQEQGFESHFSYDSDSEKWQVYFLYLDGDDWEGTCPSRKPTPWEAVARACLLALESEAGK